MREVAATDAKARLSQLLSDVERGESVAITRHGKVIARLVPEDDPELVKARERRRVVQRFREHLAVREKTGLSRDEILALRREGQKY